MEQKLPQFLQISIRDTSKWLIIKLADYQKKNGKAKFLMFSNSSKNLNVFFFSFLYIAKYFYLFCSI